MNPGGRGPERTETRPPIRDATGTRLVAAYVDCGAVCAALEVRNGDIQPIGSRSGCAACGETTFAPLPQSSDAAPEARAKR